MKELPKLNVRHLSYVNVFLLANRLETVMDKSLKEISTKQWIALIMLGTFESPPTLKELAAKCGITHQSAMQLMKRLQHKGYVSIVPDDKDKRAVRIAATDKCEKWKDQYAADHMQYIDMLFSDLDKHEIETFCMAQFKIYERLEKMAEELTL